jgi:hypothetical protein
MFIIDPLSLQQYEDEAKLKEQDTYSTQWMGRMGHYLWMNQLKFKKISIILEDFREYISN